jgi:two-component system chemotaxis response regulator CheB
VWCAATAASTIRPDPKRKQTMTANVQSIHSPAPVGALDLVVLAASAGGVKALIGLLGRLPQDFPVPIIVVQHMSPTFDSQLDQILDRRCRLHVKFAQSGDALVPGTVYLAPRNQHVLIGADRRLRLSHAERVHYTRPAADPLFASAARFGPRALAIVLTGKGRDGADGARLMRAAGGVVITQDEVSADAADMPRAARGSADVVLPLDVIPSALIALAMDRRARSIFGFPRRATNERSWLAVPDGPSAN